MAREKYLGAQQLADSGVPLRTTALIFHGEPMMTAINYARSLEQDGTFGPALRDAWTLAGDEMRRYSVREIPTSWDVPIRLGLREAELTRAEQMATEIEQLLPGQFQAQEKLQRESLTTEQENALQTAAIDRTEAEQKMVAQAEATLKVTWPMVASAAPADLRNAAKKLAARYVEAEETAEMIDRYRDIVNYNFWRATCEAEVTEPALRARETAWRAEQEFQNAQLQAAKKSYEESFAAWREVLDAAPVLRADELTAEELAELIARYRMVLEQLDEKLPTPFILQDILDRTSTVAQ